MEGRRVVVITRPKVELADLVTERTYAARILDLGLTAYSTTKEGALEKLQRMFTSSVHARREIGKDTLENWLNLSGLEWAYEDDHKVLVLTA